jgi:hypothetical protein
MLAAGPVKIPAATMLPPPTLPTAETTPPVIKLAPVIFPVELTEPPVIKLPPVMFPEALKLAGGFELI